MAPLTLLTCGHPSHSGAMQEELDLGTFHKQEETLGDHKGEDKASEKDHRNGVGTEIRRLFSRCAVLTSV